MALDDFMSFRLTYLQAIARSFTDRPFLDAMVKAQDGLKFLGSHFPNAPLPDWSIEVRFQEDKLPGNGYHPELTGSWVGPRAQMTLCLPAAPKNVADRAQALAAYYQLLPSPFGQKPGSSGTARGVGGSTGGVGTSAGTSAGAGGAGMGHESAGFVLGGVILRALALSWQDPIFAQQLIGNPDALTVLENWQGYSCPWNMQFLVEASMSEFKGGVWDPVPTNRLTFFVPTAPTDVGVHALALASYNQTGDAYPLTCP